VARASIFASIVGIEPRLGDVAADQRRVIGRVGHVEDRQGRLLGGGHRPF
jgi:hypothetical protein